MMTTPDRPRPAAGKLTGTRARLACAQYGTPTLVPVTVPAVTVTAGTSGIGSDGSRMPAVRIISPAATPGSSARRRPASPTG